MSSDPIISLRNVSKIYRAYDHPLHRLIDRISGGRAGRYKEFHALHDISFDIAKGDTVGIIGRNGSGKSTLLQIICGIRRPSTGGVSVNGRISALLELGSGFQPDFTGRENVFLQGAIIGLTRDEMETRFDDIVAFADIGEYIDQPVKTYSSGMYVRLAFAVAISIDPDILVVDEALAVGDTGFQRKCFERIRQIREQGCTIMYVSHNMASVVELCNHALLLEHGQLVATGSPKLVTAAYLKSINSQNIANHAENLPKIANEEEAEIGAFDQTLIPESSVSYPSLGAQILNPRILSVEGKRVNLLRSGEEYVYAYEAKFDAPAKGVRFGMLIKTISGYELGGLTSHPAGEGIPVECGATISQKFRFRCNLLHGTYFLNAGITCHMPGKGEEYLHRILDAAMFKVMPGNRKVHRGVVDLSPLSEEDSYHACE